MLLHGLLFLLAFVVIWLTAGHIVSAVDHMAQRLKISPFVFSFFVLGLFTSAPELIIGATSIIQKQPEIFVGNLLGASLLLFGMLIPLLAIVTGSITFRHAFSQPQLLLILFYIALPAFLAADQYLPVTDGLILLALYPIAWLLLDKKALVATKLKNQLNSHRKSTKQLWVTLSVSVLLLSGASHVLVTQIAYLASLLAVPAFYISLLVVSLGSNLPELVLIIKSLGKGHREVAFGNYLGSAVANSVILGLLILLTNQSIGLPNPMSSILVFVTLIIILFYLFSRSQRKISRVEGLALVVIYTLFIISEILNYTLR